VIFGALPKLPPSAEREPINAWLWIERAGTICAVTFDKAVALSWRSHRYRTVIELRQVEHLSIGNF
jgi:hypothetical protein